MITADSPEHSKYIKNDGDGSYTILTDKLEPNEEIACNDDKDMSIIKNADKSVTLKKKCFSNNCFSRK